MQVAPLFQLVPPPLEDELFLDFYDDDSGTQEFMGTLTFTPMAYFDQAMYDSFWLAYITPSILISENGFAISLVFRFYE
ncbi:MAG: hypothetical protein SH856_11685 [Flavobacteriales bacterium]|nr:hypothetical protein [Flavobacteriales bacterium]